MPEGQPSISEYFTKAKEYFRKKFQKTPKTPRVRIIDSAETPIKVLHGVSIAANEEAAKYYINKLRDASLYHQDPYSRFLVDTRGFKLEAPVETGFFSGQDLLNVAEVRYRLPMAMYITGLHARLVLKGPFLNSSNERVIQIYDPMIAGISEILLPNNDPSIHSGIYANNLAQPEINSGTYNISFLDDPRLSEYRHSLLNGKLASLQKDAYNCIPFCLFVNSLVHALKPGETEFKTYGIPKFAEDIGVRVLKREELIPSRVRIS